MDKIIIFSVLIKLNIIILYCIELLTCSYNNINWQYTFFIFFFLYSLSKYKISYLIIIQSILFMFLKNQLSTIDFYKSVPKDMA